MDNADKNKKENSFREWRCFKCRHEVLAVDKPQPIRWADGHVCRFVQVVLDEKLEMNTLHRA